MRDSRFYGVVKIVLDDHRAQITLDEGFFIADGYRSEESATGRTYSEPLKNLRKSSLRSAVPVGYE